MPSAVGEEDVTTELEGRETAAAPGAEGDVRGADSGHTYGARASRLGDVRHKSQATHPVLNQGKPEPPLGGRRRVQAEDGPPRTPLPLRARGHDTEKAPTRRGPGNADTGQQGPRSPGAGEQ